MNQELVFRNYTNEMKRIANYHNPNKWHVWTRKAHLAKLAIYEQKCFHRALNQEKLDYCLSQNIPVEEYESTVLQNPDLLDLLFERTIARIPKTCKLSLSSSLP